MINIVNGRGDTVGSPLINHAAVRMISVTGSIATGRKVLQAAQATLKRTHLELGGKAPVIVFDDADLEAVVGGLRTFGYYKADMTAPLRADLRRRENLRQVAPISVRQSRPSSSASPTRTIPRWDR